ncbi:MAG: iron-containing alcohol dehydrogenase [Candidatus Magnetomorum sp.]|nr:iron-containing alcohol dehydrogenase [Candidatus Magnetomorum sp.]
MHIPGYFEFCCRVKTLAGHNALESIPEALAQLQAKTPLILTDKGVAGAGLIDIVINAIKDKMTIGSIEDDIPPDSDLRVVNHLAGVYREKNCDAIIAVGGGSVMDTAKGVNIVVSENADDLIKFCGAGAIKRPLNPMIAIPTTSGTGSEVTLVAVIADHEKNRKMLFTSYFLLPDVAVLDSRMTLTLPPFLTSSTGMDAMTHAIEAYTCLAKNPLSDTHALAGIELLSQNLLNVVQNPDDQEGRLALAKGANLAGIAFSNSMVGMVHTLGHSIGSVCHVPHGTCMSILLPYGLEYNLHKNSEFVAEVLYPLAGPEIFAKTPKNQRAEKVIEYVRKMNQDLYDATGGRHSRCFKEVLNRDGKQMVTKEDLPKISKTALGDGSIFYNPEELDYDDCMMVLNAAWEGTPLNRNKIKKG